MLRRASLADCSALRVPGPPLLGDLAFLLEAWKHAVEIVLLDPHLRRELGNRDICLGVHERKRLSGARAAAFAPTGASFARWTARFGGGAPWFVCGSFRACRSLRDLSHQPTRNGLTLRRRSRVS
jgi:hypothetical protein